MKESFLKNLCVFGCKANKLGSYKFVIHMYLFIWTQNAMSVWRESKNRIYFSIWSCEQSFGCKFSFALVTSHEHTRILMAAGIWKSSWLWVCSIQASFGQCWFGDRLGALFCFWKQGPGEVFHTADVQQSVVLSCPFFITGYSWEERKFLVYKLSWQQFLLSNFYLFLKYFSSLGLMSYQELELR